MNKMEKTRQSFNASNWVYTFTYRIASMECFVFISILTVAELAGIYRVCILA